jgi:hypothetical protein
MLQINGMADHVHMFIGVRPTQSLSKLMQQVKEDSSNWIKDKRLVRGRFNWQEGYGVFSYSRSQVPQVIKYIQEQEKHHSKKTFLEEYEEMLKAFEVEYDERCELGVERSPSGAKMFVEKALTPISAPAGRRLDGKF